MKRASKASIIINYKHPCKIYYYKIIKPVAFGILDAKS